jgi:predicted RND superfamily exporter protein
MDSYNVTLTFHEADAVKDPNILKTFDRFITDVERLPLVKRVSSVLDILKDMNQVMHDDDPSYYRVPDTQALIAQLLLLYEMANGSELQNWVDYDYTTLRLMVEVKDTEAAEVEREFHLIRKTLNDLFPDAKFGMIGGVVQLSVAQNYIARGEIVSFFIALIVIGILMILVFRSVKTGLIGMIPNLAPIIVMGGLMGYLDIPLEMNTMVIIPMLLGLAVDDTIHFITHCKLEFQRTGDYQTSIEKTFQTVGKAIFMTSFILVAIFLVYMTSIARFFNNVGLLAMSGVVSALLADYFITPVLVKWSKPYGKENAGKGKIQKVVKRKNQKALKRKNQSVLKRKIQKVLKRKDVKSIDK